MATLTNANSVLMLGVNSLFNIPIKIEGYAADDSFATADAESGETVMGIDGRLSAGYTPYPVELEITLQSDSSSITFFEAIIDAELIAKEKYELNGSLLIPSISKIYALTRGFLTTISPTPTGKKILQPRKFKITFESCVASPA